MVKIHLKNNYYLCIIMAKQKKIPEKKVEELKKITEEKKSAEAKVKPVTAFRTILNVIK